MRLRRLKAAVFDRPVVGSNPTRPSSPSVRGRNRMDGASLGPLTFRQRLFWFFAIGFLVAFLVVLFLATEPAYFTPEG